MKFSVETLALARKYTEQYVDDYVEEHGGIGVYVLYDSTAGWNAQPDLVAAHGVIYVYSDYSSVTIEGDTVPVPGFKVGDGVTLLKDLPFSADAMGAVLPSGGEAGDILVKTGSGTSDMAWQAPANKAEEDNTKPITSAAVYNEIGNINILLDKI